MLRLAVSVTCSTPLLLLCGEITGELDFLTCLESLALGEVCAGCHFGFGLICLQKGSRIAISQAELIS